MGNAAFQLLRYLGFKRTGPFCSWFRTAISYVANSRALYRDIDEEREVGGREEGSCEAR